MTHEDGAAAEGGAVRGTGQESAVTAGSGGGATDAGDAWVTVFQEHRPVLEGVAYRMLGQVTDAEDIVQEAWLRWSAADRAQVRDSRAFLVRVTTRLAIDRLRLAQTRRESYPGPWLPEPLPTDPAVAAPPPEGADRAALNESVSFAVLVVLESLSPLERAVFVLREAFGFPYSEIAEALERGESAVRQLAGRARKHVAERRSRFEADPGQQRELTERFLTAATGGDLSQLLAVLAPEARLVGDGGGKAKAPLNTLVSADKVGRFLAAIGQQAAEFGFTFTELNGVPAVLATLSGRVAAVFALDVAEGRIQTVYIVTNPDKLAHLSATVDDGHADPGSERP